MSKRSRRNGGNGNGKTVARSTSELADALANGELDSALTDADDLRRQRGELPDPLPEGVEKDRRGRFFVWQETRTGKSPRYLGEGEVWERYDKQKAAKAAVQAEAVDAEAAVVDEPAEATDGAVVVTEDSTTTVADESVAELAAEPEATSSIIETRPFDEARQLVVAFVGSPTSFTHKDASKLRRLVDLSMSREQVHALLGLLPEWSVERTCSMTGQPFTPYLTERQYKKIKSGKTDLIYARPPTMSQEGYRQMVEQRRDQKSKATDTTPVTSTPATGKMHGPPEPPQEPEDYVEAERRAAAAKVNTTPTQASRPVEADEHEEQVLVPPVPPSPAPAAEVPLTQAAPQGTTVITSADQAWLDQFVSDMESFSGTIQQQIDELSPPLETTSA